MTPKTIRRLLTWVVLIPLFASGLGRIAGAGGILLSAQALQGGQPAATGEFVPVSELPPEAQLPAAPLVVAAYAVAWIMIIGYVFTLWRRLGTVQRELTDVTRRLGERQRGA